MNFSKIAQPFKAALNYLKSIIKFIDDLCIPNHKHDKDRMQRVFNHKRNRAFLVFQSIILLVFLLDLFKAEGSFLVNIQAFLTVFCVLACFLLSRTCHPEVFKLIFSFFLFGYGLYITVHGDEGVYSSWLAVQTFPIFIYLFTASFWHFAFHCAFHLVVMNTLYQDYLIKAIIEASPTIFTRIFTKTSNLSMIFNITFVGLNHYFLQNAYQQASFVEKQTEEFEKQKTFLLSFSHELRNLLNSLLGNLELANLENPPPKIKSLLRDAETCADLLLHLVNNILDSGKVEINDLEINRTPNFIYNTVEKSWRTCSDIISKKDLHGKLRIHRNIPICLDIDHYRIRQIIFNLVENSLIFTNKGRIDISIEWLSNQKEVDESCFKPYPYNEADDQDEGMFEIRQKMSVFDKNMYFLSATCQTIDKSIMENRNDTAPGILKIVVTDTGQGIAKADINKIFQKFSQISVPNSETKLRTGLGLFITHELSKKMKGEVRLFTSANNGSSITFCMPAAPVIGQTNQLFTAGSLKSIILQKRLKAIIVDDVKFNHILLKGFMNKLGVQVAETAENGQEAFKKYCQFAQKRESIQIVTMDLDMPVMNGKISAQKIREFEMENNLNPCLLIIVSGNSTESEINECIDKKGKIKANAFLQKPVTIDELGQLIARYFHMS